MALPFFAALTKRQRAALPIIRAGVKQGLTRNAIQALTREMGTGLRRSSLLQIITNVERQLATGPQLRNLNFNAVPNPNRLPEALTTIRRRFAYHVQITGLDVSSGQTRSRFVTVSTDRHLTRGQIEDEALDFALDDIDTYGLEDVSTLLESGVRSGIFGTVL